MVRGGGCEPEHGDHRRVARTSGGREEDRGISTGHAHGSRAGEPGAFSRFAGLPGDHPRDSQNLTREKRAKSGVLSAAPVVFRNDHQIFALLLLGNPDGGHSISL